MQQGAQTQLVHFVAVIIQMGPDQQRQKGHIDGMTQKIAATALHFIHIHQYFAVGQDFPDQILHGSPDLLEIGSHVQFALFIDPVQRLFRTLSDLGGDCRRDLDVSGDRILNIEIVNPDAPQPFRIVSESGRSRAQQNPPRVRIHHFPAQLHLCRQFIQSYYTHCPLLLFA